ncbi:MAG: RraA family protein [Spirochaetota bacterium]
MNSPTMRAGGMGPDAMLKLKRWNCPTIYNGWELITKRDRLEGIWNREETRDFMPWMGCMVGRAVTITIDPSNPEPPKRDPLAWEKWYQHVASIEGPKIIVMQDIGKPGAQGSFWGEVSANTHRALGCVGTITDGALRDIDEMANAGLKAIARRLCVGHLHSWPVAWDLPVTVFGQVVEPGTLIHADKHGFIGIPAEDEERLLDAVRFMDDNECETVIPAVRFAAGRPLEEIRSRRSEAAVKFGEAAKRRFGNPGEW